MLFWKPERVLSVPLGQLRDYKHSDASNSVDLFIYRDRSVCPVSLLLQFQSLPGQCTEPLFAFVVTLTCPGLWRVCPHLFREKVLISSSIVIWDDLTINGHLAQTAWINFLLNNDDLECSHANAISSSMHCQPRICRRIKLTIAPERELNYFGVGLDKEANR